MIAVPPAPTFAWQPALVALTAVVLVLFGLYYETGMAMVNIWARSETFTHAFLVPPITLWLIWEKRHILARQQPHPNLWLTLPLAALGFAWLLGEIAAVNAVTQLAFTCMLILAVPLVIGLPAARLIAFPLGFLLFAVPIGEFVMPKLMDWTAAVTVLGLRASGIPVFQEGLHFVIPSGRWSVVEACSGVRYLIASLTVGTLFAYLNYRSLKRRLIFVGVAILVPIVANWLRAYMIVMLGHLSGNEIATGVDHLVYGWLFFGVIIMIMFVIGMRWSEPNADHEQTATPVSASNPPASAQRLILVSLIFAVVSAAPHGVIWALAPGAPLPPPQLDPQTLSSGDWQLAAEPWSDWKPAFQNPSGEMNVTLTNGEHRVGVYIGYYRQQNYARKLVSSSNVLVESNDKGWTQITQANRSITLEGQVVTVRSAHLRSNAMTHPGQGVQNLVAWHWYWINGRITASDFTGKIWLALSRLTGRGDDSAVIVLYAPENKPGGAEAAIQTFLADKGASISTVLARVKEQR